MDDNITHEDREDINEGLLILIDDYVEKNIQLYKKPSFLTDIYVAVFEVAKELHDTEIISEQLLRSILNDSIIYYFNCFCNHVLW